MATLTVTTAADVVAADGLLSLREAVDQANRIVTDDTILFAPRVEGQTLRLNGGELVLDADVAIDGDRNDDGREVTLDGGISRDNILTITGSATEVALDDLTIANGRVSEEIFGGGGGIRLGGGSLDMNSCTVRNCSGYYVSRGGGIYAAEGSRLSITNSSIVDNDSGDNGFGGGISTLGDVALTVRGSRISGNDSYYSGGGILFGSGTLIVEDSVVTGNYGFFDAFGGGIFIGGGTATIARTAVTDNRTRDLGGGIFHGGGSLTVTDSTVAGNYSGGYFENSGGGIYSRGALSVRNSTVTGNQATDGGGGGIDVSRGRLAIANSIVAGNMATADGAPAPGPDVYGAVARSNGHNLFGSAVAGGVAGDRENVATSLIFAEVDPITGGGVISADGAVPLRADVTNPALSGGDPLAASATDQLGQPRPRPAGTRPDIGAVESGFAPSTSPSSNNDLLRGSDAADFIRGFAGNDFLRGRDGPDRVEGNTGSDLLEGGAGDDRILGGSGVDLARFAGAARVVVDLPAGVATRGGDRDELAGIEGAIGSNSGDLFTGDGAGNRFQGGLGQDRFTGNEGRDLYDLDAAADSPPGAGARDVIADFAPGADSIDLTGIDADAAVAGDQAFRWVGTDGLTGAGQVGFFVTAGGATLVRGSTDADAAPEFRIELTGPVPDLGASDFHL